ncbi:MAG: hypothetical protein ACE5K4_09495 [Candidatus Hydrothermarchaeota archaeon]
MISKTKPNVTRVPYATNNIKKSKIREKPSFRELEITSFSFKFFTADTRLAYIHEYAGRRIKIKKNEIAIINIKMIFSGSIPDKRAIDAKSMPKISTPDTKTMMKIDDIGIKTLKLSLKMAKVCSKRSIIPESDFSELSIFLSINFYLTHSVYPH